MNSSRKRRLSLVPYMILLSFTLLVSIHTLAYREEKQDKNRSAATVSSPALKRTTTRHEVRRLGYGGSLTIYGAPEGSITIEAWPKSEVDITADIEIEANTEEELSQLAAVNSFLLETDRNQIRVLTVGTHDKKYMKRVAKNFPKQLLAMPWKIDYHIRVPVQTDLEIFYGRGPFNLSGVEGSIRVNAGESNASLLLTGGDVGVTVARGPVSIRIGSRSWRGRGAEVRLASGDLNIELPANFNGDIDAEILRSGRIENTHTALTARDENNKLTERAQQLRAGAGGAQLTFIVGDGTLRIKQVANDK